MTAAWWMRRDPWELYGQRLALALLVLVSFRAQPRFAGQPFPVGVARWIDFSFLAAPAAAPWLLGVLLIALAAYVAGRAMAVAVATMTVLYVGAGALAYSQGSLQHHTQLLSLVLLAQLIAYVQARLTGRTRTDGHTLATHYGVEVIAAAYVLSGLMKIVLSHGQWVAQVPMVAIDVAKTHGQSFCTSGDADVLARGDRVAGAILTHPNLTRTFFAPAVLFELGAAAAPFGRLAAALVGVCLLAMHTGIDAVMKIRFWENEALLVIYFVNVPYLVLRAVGLRRRLRQQAAA